MKKKCTALLLALTILTGLLPAFAAQEEPPRSETPSAVETSPAQLALRYDDYLTAAELGARLGLEKLSLAEVQVEENSPVERIDAVVFPGKNYRAASYLHAREVGEGTITVRGQTYSLRVESAPLALFVILGQSNAEGYEGNAQDSVACAPGAAYSSYAPWDQLTADNAADFIPASLTRSVSRSGKELTGQSAVNAITETGRGKFGFDGALAWRWNQLTGEKVWTVNAAHNGTAISTWVPQGDNGKEAEAILNEVSQTLADEVANRHYTLTRAGYFWLQGCDDVDTPAQTYLNAYREMHTALTGLPLLSGEAGRHLEFGAILMVRGDLTPLGQKDQSAGLALNGPRTAQYLMAADREELANVYLVSDLGDQWVTDAQVAASFRERYGDRKRVNYVNHLGNSPKVPTTLTETHPDVHYRQLGHNELGLDAAENLYYTLEPKAAPAATPTVTFKQGGTYEDVSGGGLLTDPLTVIPIVHPTYLANRVTYTVKDFTYENGVLSRSRAGSLTALLDGVAAGTLEFRDPRLKVTYTDGVEGAELFPDQVSLVDAGANTPAFEGFARRAGWLFTGWSPAIPPTVEKDLTFKARWISKETLGTPRTELHYDRQNTYAPGLFRDVPQGEWFTEGVANAYELGLMRGINALDFGPTGEMTLAEAVTLAARIHKLYYTDDATFPQVSEDNWFRSYLDYAYYNGVISSFYYTADPRMVVTRAQFAQIMARALPDEGLPVINDIPAGAIVGVASTDPWLGAVYKLYRAGILTGNIVNAFEAYPSITRAEAAAIVSRMADSGLRRTFTLE